MKKIFILFAMMVFSLTTLFSQELGDTTEVVVTDTVQFVSVDEIEPGIVEFTWHGCDSCSEAYSIYLAQFDTVNYSVNTFSGVASYASSFMVEDSVGYFRFYTDYTLYYGSNYKTIEQQGAPEEIVAEWKTAWEACVDETDYTLNSGLYVIFVEGIDLSFNTTEVEAYAFVEVVGKTTEGIEEIKLINHSGKFIDNDGRMYIIRDNKIYNIQGNRLK